MLNEPAMQGGEQAELDFHGPVGDGYALWQADAARLRARIAELWRVPLDRPVRLRLRDLDGVFEGVLRLAERPAALDPRRPLLLKLDRMTFQHHEIESCAVIVAPPPGA